MKLKLFWTYRSLHSYKKSNFAQAGFLIVPATLRSQFHLSKGQERLKGIAVLRLIPSKKELIDDGELPLSLSEMSGGG